MSFSNPLTVRGKSLGDGQAPLICTPLVGHSEDELLAELGAVLGKSPDLLEWRVDFFGGIGDTRRLVAAGREIRAAAGNIPIIFTRRSIREGGEPISLSEAEVLNAYRAVCEAGCVDFIDWELSSNSADFAAAAQLAKDNDVQLIASFHDFDKTPPAAEIIARLVAMQAAGADVAKVAVMPQQPGDVLTLLQATLAAREQLAVPIITMSMGGYGAISRLFGWMYGSSVSFAVGEQASAPGQIPVEDLREVLAVMQRALGTVQS